MSIGRLGQWRFLVRRRSSVDKIAKPLREQVAKVSAAPVSFAVPQGIGAPAEAKGALCLHLLEDFVYSPHPFMVGW